MIDRTTSELIGRNLRRARLKLNWSQIRLAAELDVTRQTIYNWEWGATPMPSDLLKLAAEKMGRDVRWFFQEERHGTMEKT